jgi:hypothetical protein
VRRGIVERTGDAGDAIGQGRDDSPGVPVPGVTPSTLARSGGDNGSLPSAHSLLSPYLDGAEFTIPHPDGLTSEFTIPQAPPSHASLSRGSVVGGDRVVVEVSASIRPRGSISRGGAAVRW